MAVSNILGSVSRVDASARKEHRRPPVSGSPVFTRGADKLHNHSRLPPSELKAAAASIREFVERKNRRVDFDLNGRRGSAGPAFSGVEIDLPMNLHGGGKRLFVHINSYDEVSANPTLTEGQLTASLILARSAMMEKDQLQIS